MLFMPLRQALTGLDHGPDMGALLPLSATTVRSPVCAQRQITRFGLRRYAGRRRRLHLLYHRRIYRRLNH